MSPPSLTTQEIHELIVEAVRMKSLAYCPYSNFQVGAALLTADKKIIGGCNVENAAYGAGICAERTAMTKAISQGDTKIIAVAVTSPLPTPSISPCGICRQFLREFLPLDAPIYMVASAYPGAEGVENVYEGAGDAGDATVRCMTLEQLLPMSFGPEQLGR